MGGGGGGGGGGRADAARVAALQRLATGCDVQQGESAVGRGSRGEALVLAGAHANAGAGAAGSGVAAGGSVEDDGRRRDVMLMSIAGAVGADEQGRYRLAVVGAAGAVADSRETGVTSHVTHVPGSSPPTWHKLRALQASSPEPPSSH